MGRGSHKVVENIDVLKKMEQNKCSIFVENHPKILLPVKLEVEVISTENTNKNDNSSVSQDKQGSLKETWSQVVQKGIKP